LVGASFFLAMVGSSGFGRRTGTIHAHMLTGQRRMASQRFIHAIRLTLKIWIVRDRDDAGMMSRTPVQTDVVSAIACEDCTAEARREGKLLRIPDALVRLSSLKCRYDIVAKLAQPLHDGKGEVL